MRLVVVAVALVLALSACQKAGEAALSAASGGAVNMNGGKIDIKGKDGAVAHIDTAVGKMDVKNADGSTATVTTSDKGAVINAVGPDGKVSQATLGGGTLPAGFPIGVPSGLTIVNVMTASSGASKEATVIANGAASFDAVAAAVEADTKKLGYPLTKQEVKAEGTHLVSFQGASGEKTASVSVNESGGNVVLSIALKGY